MVFPTDGIIDAHVHLYPEEVNQAPLEWARRAGEGIWAGMVEERPDRRVRQGFASVDQLLRDMDAAGIAHVILLGWYWEKQASCEMQNRFYASCARAHPDRISAFAAVQVEAGVETAAAEMRRAKDDGLIGLGEMCPWAFGGRPCDDRWLKVFHLAEVLGWPVNLHVTDPTSRPFPGRVDTPLEDVVELAETCPRLRLILAHLGGGLVFHEYNPRTRKALCNAVYDTAAVPLLYRRGVYAAAIRAVGEGRVLFGTDYPLMVFPKTQTCPDFRPCIDHIRDGLQDSGLVGSLLGDAARVLFSAQES